MKVQEFDKTIQAILDGKQPFSELIEVEPIQANLFKLSGNVAFYQPKQVKTSKITWLKEEYYIGYTIWYPSVFLQKGGMSDKFDGTGLLVSSGRLFAFTLCEHDWDESGANPSRGWHPKRCKKCGFDASIDSGD